MEELKIFENEEFGQVRTIVINNEPWFVGKDVANNLGYRNGSRDINRHVSDEDRIKEMIFDGNQNKETILINESGLYALIFGSKLESAKRFKRWVTSEVLPSIRKTGNYISNEDQLRLGLFDKDPLVVVQSHQKLVAIEVDRATAPLIAENTVMKPKADYHDEVLNKDDLINTTVIAKDLGLRSAAKLNNIMHSNNIIYKNSSGTWCPYADYEWLITKNYADYKSYNVENSNPCLKWTEKGRKWIIENYGKWICNSKI